MYHADIWRTVVLLTRNFGAEAFEFASERADAQFDAGNRADCELWIGVGKALDDFLSPTPRLGETMH